jgi:hypothetical protein
MSIVIVPGEVGDVRKFRHGPKEIFQETRAVRRA